MKNTIKFVALGLLVTLIYSKSEAAEIKAQPCLKPVTHAHKKSGPVESPACVAPTIVLPCPTPEEPLDYIPEVPSWYRYPVTPDIQPTPGFWSRIWGGATADVVGGPASTPRFIAAPEIDPSSATSALTLLAGGLWIVIRKGKRF